MNDKRRPPSLHRGPAPAQESPDPNVTTFAFTMSNREIATITAQHSEVDQMAEKISEAIARRLALVLHGSDGRLIIVNTAHVVLVNTR